MTKLRITFFGLLLIVILCLTVRADNSTNVHSISRREGLSNGAVNTIARDAEGYIWLGTWNGLNRYDGNSIVTYLPGSKPNAIHNHVIRELFPTSLGPVWMLTNKGIAYYDNVHDRFTAYFTSEPEQINYENDIALAYSDKFGTLASVFGRGLFRYDKLADQFIQIIPDRESLAASINIKRIHLIDNRAYCITVNGELFRLSGHHLEKIMQLPITGTLTSSTLLQINHKPYLLVTQRTGAALMIDPVSKEVRPLRIPDDVITSFTVSQKNSRIWTGTEKGRIYSYNLQDHTFEELGILSESYSNKPIATRILCIYETDPDILWIGTDGNGAFTMKLTEFPTRRLSSEQLAYPIVRSILVTRSGDVLVGTKGGGIDIFNAKGSHTRRISVKDGLSNNSVLSFHERSDGTIWVGTDGKGVDIISPDYRRIRNFPRDFIKDYQPGFASVYRILEDIDNRIYLGTSGYGVIMIDFSKQDGSLPLSCTQLVLDKSIAPGQQKQIVYALAAEKPGIIWIGTRGFGVYRYNTITRRVIAQYSSSTNPVIKNDDILTLFTDHKGYIWAGSSDGIFNILPISADSVWITGLKAHSELSNTSIHAIQQDRSNNLWVTTNQGLSLIDVKRQNVRSFNVNDGLINMEYSDGASFFDEGTNRLFVGGTMGLDIIQSDAIRFSSYFPPIAINQFLIRNVPVEIGNESVLKSRINHQQKLELKYNQNSITFYISPLAYWGQERYKISYRLKNFDDEWVVNLKNQPISFSNLESGTYTLQIRVSDENGTWSDNIREIEIEVNPPFWLTSWAIIGYIVIIIGIQLWVFTAYKRREVRRKETMLREFEQKKEEELQAYKIEFFTNLAHEFRTPLTLITSHIHAIIEDKQLTVEKPRLLKVYNNSLKLQKLVLEIMQFRKLEKGKEPLNIQLINPVELTREVVSDFDVMLEQRKIVCKVEAPDENITFKMDADKFQRILSNLISNAIKYNKDNGFVKVSLRIENRALIVEVEDHGIGIKPEYQLKIFEPFSISSARKRASYPGYRSTGLGLAVTKGLVELLKGTITMESSPGTGTRFTCTLPDVHEVNTTELISEPQEHTYGDDFIDPDFEDTEIKDLLTVDGKPLLLLVDDDPEILALLRDFLQADYNIVFAENGEEAYRKVLSDKPDLIVSDVMMPEMDGIELCCKLRENIDTSHLPLILLTAKAEIEDRIAGLKAGADSYIPKPFHPEHLKVRIEKLLATRADIRQYFGQQYGAGYSHLNGSGKGNGNDNVNDNVNDNDNGNGSSDGNRRVNGNGNGTSNSNVISSGHRNDIGSDMGSDNGYGYDNERDRVALIKAIPDPIFQKMLGYIDENLDDEALSSEKLCEKLAISKTSLYNKTKSVLGTTPHSLINQRRLYKATTLLTSTTLTVSEIIDQTGFASRTHFYELFNKAYGCSPTEYRNTPLN